MVFITLGFLVSSAVDVSTGQLHAAIDLDSSPIAANDWPPRPPTSPEVKRDRSSGKGHGSMLSNRRLMHKYCI